jgi:hypothetical protein
VLNQVEHRRKHVAVVIGSELLAGNAEGGARDACRKQVDASEILMPEVANVLLYHVPVRAILAQGCAELRLAFNSSGVVEARHLEAEGLTATTRAKFEDGKTHVNRFDFICGRSASGYEHDQVLLRFAAPPETHSRGRVPKRGERPNLP